MMRARASPLRGFTLLELSIVLPLIGVIIAMGLATLTGSLEASQHNATLVRMDAIENALRDFAIANGRIPCPSDLTQTGASATYGAEAGAGAGSSPGIATGACTGASMVPVANFKSASGAVEGGVPTRALQLPDDYMYDGWGRRFRYAADRTMTATGALPFPAGGLCSPSASTITVNDAAGGARTTAGIYAIVSQGANGHGAYTSNGVVLNAGSVNAGELRNCNCISTGVYAGTYTPTYVEKVPTLNSANAFDSYDDIVAFKEGWQMQAQNYPLAAKLQCTLIYVADSGNNRVQKFDIGGNYLDQFGSSGSGDGQFSTPDYIHTDSSGNFWVGDRGNERLQKFDGSFNFLTSIGGGWCNPPCNGSFSNPHAAVIDTGGNIWATDTGWNRVQEFNSGGVWQNTYGQTDAAGDASSTSGKFSGPEDIVFDPGGNFYVSDYYNDRVEKFDSSGVWQSSLTANLSRPTGMAVDSGGNLWVADCWDSYIVKYNSSGSYVTRFGTKGSGAGELNCPLGIAIDSSGNFWIADYNNNRVQEFNSSGSYVMSVGAGYNGVSGAVGSIGAGNGQFNGPYGIAVSGR